MEGPLSGLSARARGGASAVGTTDVVSDAEAALGQRMRNARL